MKKGTDVTIMTIVSGSKKNAWPKTSMASRQRFGSMPLTMSMRMCSLDRSVQGEHKRNIAPNRTHCSSSHAFDEVSKTFRTVALVAEMTTTTRISQDKTLPIRKLTASMARLSLSKPSTHRPLGLVRRVAEQPLGAASWFWPRRQPPPGHPNLPRPPRGRQLEKRTRRTDDRSPFSLACHRLSD